jgi:hypothetical protein
MYGRVKLRGLRNDELLIHIHRQDDHNCDMVEFYMPGDPVSLTKEQFDSMAAWVNHEFEILAQKEAPKVH